jgi:fibro-slime domain-containing protein
MAIVSLEHPQRRNTIMPTSLHRTTVLTYAVLALAAAVPILLPSDILPVQQSQARYGSQAEDPQDTMVLTAIIRDFKAAEERGGHPDFQAFSGTTRVGLVESTLGTNGKPVLASRSGRKITSEFRDADGRNINPALYEPELGDQTGALEDRTDPRITSAESFSSWYTDMPGVNMSTAVDLTLVRESGSDVYVFDSNTDPYYKTRGGFFPIDSSLFGNYGRWDNNFHFTTEIETEFTFRRGAGYVFKFTGDDDVWVFIDGKLVIDLGSLHAVKEQFIDLDRLSWLEDGTVYPLKVFHAERRTSQSNFRMETTLPLRSTSVPDITAAFD